jgi:NAD(P)-dependent dehydrogenase (short-subunit alcohol dehydrogenase family)
MHDKPVALVTGANKGIGLQIAKDLAAHGFTVLVGSRNLERGETAAKSVGGDARALQLDVTNQASIAAAAKRIRNELGRLDVLVNNAAISHAGKPGRSLEEIVKSGRPSVASIEEVRAVFETNVFRRHRRHASDAATPSLSAGGTHRQRSERQRLADNELGPDQSVSRALQRRLQPVEDCPQRDHARLRLGTRVDTHQGQRRVPGLHRNGP